MLDFSGRALIPGGNRPVVSARCVMALSFTSEIPGVLEGMILEAASVDPVECVLARDRQHRVFVGIVSGHQC